MRARATSSCAHRGSRSDTCTLDPPRWCSALDKDACAASFATTIHGEPKLCQWLDVGCRTGNVSLCAAERPGAAILAELGLAADASSASTAPIESVEADSGGTGLRPRL